MTREFGEIEQAVRRFRDDRDWAHFHNPKDLAVSVCLEAAELLEHFQWKDEGAARTYLADSDRRADVAGEMADVVILLVSLADVLDVDLHAAALEKIRSNAVRYPVEKSRGTAAKYDEL